MELKDIRLVSERIKGNIQKVIIGKDRTIDFILTAMISGGHVLLEDTPGTGKTLLAKSLARSLDGDFRRIQFTPDLLPSDITGLNIFNRESHSFEFVKGPVFSNVLLADEINRATPRTQSSLLECMEEKQVTADGKTRILDRPFLVIATQNPIETAGTFPLPEAQLDRFMMQLSMGFPTESEELSIIERFISKNPMEELTPVCSKDEIIEMGTLAAAVYTDISIRKYIVDIVNATRNNSNISSGVSPRGTLALLKASQVYAAIQGRDFVTPEDVKTLAVPVLAHRIVSFTNMVRNANRVKLINEILETVAVPAEDFTYACK